MGLLSRSLSFSCAVGFDIIATFFLSKTATVPSPSLLLVWLHLATIVSSVWLLLQYTVQVPWIVKNLISIAPPWITAILSSENMMLWIGVVAENAPVAPSKMEQLLRLKSLLLIAIALKQQSMKWLVKLPLEVREAGPCHAACALFWPPYPGYLGQSMTGTIADRSASPHATQLSTAQQPPPPGGLLPDTSSGPGSIHDAPITIDNILSRSSSLSSAQVILHNTLSKVRDIAQQALQAVDWPSPRPESPSVPATASTVRHQEEVAGNDTAHCGASLIAAHNTEEHASAERSIVSTQEVDGRSREGGHFIAFKYALQDWIERWYAEWGIEVCLFLLLIAAFIAADALSLVYMIIVAVGMSVSGTLRRRAWSWVVTPLLGLILVWQYGELVGMPPTVYHGCSMLQLAPDSRSDFLTWLGLQGVAPGSVWSLFFAFVASVLQVQYDIGTTQHGADGTGQNYHHTNNGSMVLWAPLRHSSQPAWHWHDWFRYLTCKWYLDALLVIVVTLCSLDNDIVHAGYLAIALFFFRARISLRSRKNSLFWWLPAYNFAVMMVALAYQAPFEDVWDWSLDDGKVREMHTVWRNDQVSKWVHQK